MPVCMETYRSVALEDPEGQWELHHGRLVQKPNMTTEHNSLARILGFKLQLQLDLNRFTVSTNTGRVGKADEDTSYIPDVMIIPTPALRRLLATPGTFEEYEEPLPLVAEVWSRSTGSYDINTKLPDYRRRGDAESWRLHPYQRVLTTWRRQPDGSYEERTVWGGTVRLHALPQVEIDLDELFTLELG